MGAVVVPYNGLGIVGLNNVHLTCTILDVISAESKSLMLKDWRSTLAAALFNSRVTGEDTNSENLRYRQESSFSSSRRKASSSLGRPQKKPAYEEVGNLRNTLSSHAGWSGSNPSQDRPLALATSSPGNDSSLESRGRGHQRQGSSNGHLRGGHPHGRQTAVTVADAEDAAPEAATAAEAADTYHRNIKM